MADELTRRNTESVFQWLKDMDARVRAQQLQIETLNRVVSDVNDRLLVLERAATEQRIQTMGTGPTETNNGNLD